MSSIFLGRRSDGSSLILARPHGAPTRVGTVHFRSVFFALGPDRRIRSCILIHLGQVDWRQLRNSNARLLLLFEYSSASAVQSPQVQRVRAPGSPAVSSGPSISSDSPISASDSSDDSQRYRLDFHSCDSEIRATGQTDIRDFAQPTQTQGSATTVWRTACPFSQAHAEIRITSQTHVRFGRSSTGAISFTTSRFTSADSNFWQTCQTTCFQRNCMQSLATIRISENSIPIQICLAGSGMEKHFASAGPGFISFPNTRTVGPPRGSCCQIVGSICGFNIT